MADSSVENAALKLIRAIPGWSSCRALELGCGDGRLLETLVTAGCDARGTTFRGRTDDYIRQRDYPEGITARIDGGIDLNEPLPYADNAFDLVYSTEVLEHVESHRTFITEAGRVLRVGGHLVLTTPNLHRLKSRFQYVMTGMHGLKRRYITPKTPVWQMEEFHCFTADFHILHYLLHRAGLKIRSVASTGSKLGGVLGMAIYPVSWIATRNLAFRKVPLGEEMEVRRDLYRWLLSPTLMLSEHLAIHCEKVREGDRLWVAPARDAAGDAVNRPEIKVNRARLGSLPATGARSLPTTTTTTRPIAV